MRIFTEYIWAAFRKLVAMFAVLGTAEIRIYDWDGLTLLRNKHGWTDMYGDPYAVSYNANATGYVSGGWLDVRGMNTLRVDCEVTGAAADAAGNVSVIFQAAYSVIDPIQRYTSDDLVVAVNLVGTDVVHGYGNLDVAAVPYIRVFGCTNMANRAASVRVTCTDAAKPA